MPELVCPIYHLFHPVLNLLEDLTGRLRLSDEPLGVGEFSDCYTANHDVQGFCIFLMLLQMILVTY